MCVESYSEKESITRKVDFHYETVTKFHVAAVKEDIDSDSSFIFIDLFSKLYIVV